jgi:hypothetical protein
VARAAGRVRLLVGATPHTHARPALPTTLAPGRDRTAREAAACAAESKKAGLRPGKEAASFAGLPVVLVTLFNSPPSLTSSPPSGSVGVSRGRRRAGGYYYYHYYYYYCYYYCYNYDYPSSPLAARDPRPLDPSSLQVGSGWDVIAPAGNAPSGPHSCEPFAPSRLVLSQAGPARCGATLCFAARGRSGCGPNRPTGPNSPNNPNKVGLWNRRHLVACLSVCLRSCLSLCALFRLRTRREGSGCMGCGVASQAWEVGCLSFPEDFPDTLAGRMYEAHAARSAREAFFRKASHLIRVIRVIRETLNFFPSLLLTGCLSQGARQACELQQTGQCGGRRRSVHCRVAVAATPSWHPTPLYFDQ